MSPGTGTVSGTVCGSRTAWRCSPSNAPASLCSTGPHSCRSPEAAEAKPALGQMPLVCGVAPDPACPDGAGLGGEQGGDSVWKNRAGSAPATFSAPVSQWPRPGPGLGRVARVGPRAGRPSGSPLSGPAHGALVGVGQELRAQARGAVHLPAPEVRGGLREVHGESPGSPRGGAGKGREGPGAPQRSASVPPSDAHSQNSLSPAPLGSALETRHRPWPGSPQPRGEGHDSGGAVWGDLHGDAAWEQDLKAGRAGGRAAGQEESPRRRPRRESRTRRGRRAASAVLGRNRGGAAAAGLSGKLSQPRPRGVGVKTDRHISRKEEGVEH